MSNLDIFEVSEFTAKHMDSYRPREYETAAGLDAFKNILIESSKVGVTLAIYDKVEKETLFAMGIIPCWPGVADAWMLASDNTYKHSFFCVRTVRNFVELNMPKLGLHRLQCSVLSCQTQNARFVETIGFEHEGLMRKYGPNMDNFHRYAKVL